MGLNLHLIIPLSAAVQLYQGAQHCGQALLFAVAYVQQHASDAERELMGAEVAGPAVVPGAADSYCKE